MKLTIQKKKNDDLSAVKVSQDYLPVKTFIMIKTQKVVAAQQGMKCGVAAITSKVQSALIHDLWVI